MEYLDAGLSWVALNTENYRKQPCLFLVVFSKPNAQY